MHNSLSETTQNVLKPVDVLLNIRLTNVTEIKVIQEVISFIDTKCSLHKDKIYPASVAALILNSENLPSLYATSSRGYNNQRLKFQDQYGVKVREELLPWAIDRVLKIESASLSLSETTINLTQNASKKFDIFEVLANIDLANVTEFQVIEEAFNHIRNNYPKAVGIINLSDVCALTLNHQDVPSFYATSASAYDRLKQTYKSQFQPQVSSIIQRVVAKVHAEGSEHSISQDSLISVNYQRRNRLTKSWNY